MLWHIWQQLDLKDEILSRLKLGYAEVTQLETLLWCHQNLWCSHTRSPLQFSNCDQYWTAGQHRCRWNKLNLSTYHWGPVENGLASSDWTQKGCLGSSTSNKKSWLLRMTIIPYWSEVWIFSPGKNQGTTPPAEARPQGSHSSTHVCLALFYCLFWKFRHDNSHFPTLEVLILITVSKSGFLIP